MPWGASFSTSVRLACESGQTGEDGLAGEVRHNDEVGLMNNLRWRVIWDGE